MKTLLLSALGPDDIPVIPSVVEPEDAPPEAVEALRRELGLKKGVRIIGTVAALVPHKNPLLMIEAVHALSRIHYQQRAFAARHPEHSATATADGHTPDSAGAARQTRRSDSAAQRQTALRFLQDPAGYQRGDSRSETSRRKIGRTKTGGRNQRQGRDRSGAQGSCLSADGLLPERR